MVPSSSIGSSASFRSGEKHQHRHLYWLCVYGCVCECVCGGVHTLICGCIYVLAQRQMASHCNFKTPCGPAHMVRIQRSNFQQQLAFISDSKQ